MTKSICVTSLALALSASSLSIAPRAASVPTPPRYYLSLGDSLSVGAQPHRSTLERPFPFVGVGGFGASVTHESFSDQLAAVRREDISNLHLVKLGCIGESTTSMIHGAAGIPAPAAPDVGLCNYRLGSQLNDAVAFLSSHRGEVAFVTISIGANDVIPCGIDPTCLGAALATIQTNLVTILTRLRAAAGPGVPIAGMNYFSPAVVIWSENPVLAQLVVNATVQFNNVLEAVYFSAGSPVADVETAFSTTDFTLTPAGIPLNVARICQWTWMCTPFRDGHPNEAGYAVIAQAFLQALP